MSRIQTVHALEILDSRGNPTLEVVVTTADGFVGKAMVPSGASTGEHEAVELRDNDKARYRGKGVKKAVANVNGPLAALLLGKEVCEQAINDRLLLDADGSANKANLGANALLGVSLALARAAAASLKQPLYRYIGGSAACLLPCPMMNILNGGAHSDSPLDFQEFMIRPKGLPSFGEALRCGVEIFHTLKDLLKSKKLSTAVGDEGGFAPSLASHEEALDYIVHAIEKAGYVPGQQVSIALDCAASEFYDPLSKSYIEKKKKEAGAPFTHRSSAEQVEYLASLVNSYPIDSIEDGLDQNDWPGWELLTKRLGKQIQLVGDDLFVTNTEFLKKGIDQHVANAILIKVNQIGTLTETLDAIKLAKAHHYRTVISHRSGETEDTTIADISVAVGAGQIKTGAPCRTDRVCKYNRLLEIQDELGSEARFTPLNGIIP